MKAGILQELESSGLVAIIRGGFTQQQIVEFGHALMSGGIRAIEVTLTTPNALEAISLLIQELGDSALIGAGTVMTMQQVDLAATAGAKYFLAPGIDTACIKRADEHDLPFIPGVFTPTEIGLALAHDCELLKLFPAAEVRPEYVTAMRGPFPSARFMATGGIDNAQIEPYYRAGVRSFGIGSTLVERGATPHQVEYKARTLVTELKRVQGAA